MENFIFCAVWAAQSYSLLFGESTSVDWDGALGSKHRSPLDYTYLNTYEALNETRYEKW